MKKNMFKRQHKAITVLSLLALLLSLFSPYANTPNFASTTPQENVVINEIAWMGTTGSTADEWIELFNNSVEDVDLTGWTLKAADGTPSIALSGVIKAKGYYLLERTDDTSVPTVAANQIYTGDLGNTTEFLSLSDSTGNLKDSTESWYAGNNTTKATMSRILPSDPGNVAGNWATSTQPYGVGLGTPGKRNELTPKSAEGPAVVINEIAWMGTTADYNDEWVELYNNTDADIDLNGWIFKAADGIPLVSLSGTIQAHGYFLLERTDDTSVPEIAADQIYTGAIGNTGESFVLLDSAGETIDSIDSTYTGDNTTKATMERINSLEIGSDSANWTNAITVYIGGYGTPRAQNQTNTPDETGGGDGGGEVIPPGTGQPPESINNVSELDGAINVYFIKSALTQYATPGNETNYNVNLEDRLLKRINEATSSLDIATYEINLPRLINAIEDKAAQGVVVRMIVDAKDMTGVVEDDLRYEQMKLYLEKLYRGKDNVIGTSDDVKIISDSPMFAVEDPARRTAIGLPDSAADITEVTVIIGTKTLTGRMFVDAERKSTGNYYSPGDQMHNKFVIADRKWVWTGSWNFTITGTYGSEENMASGILDGNQQNSIEINSAEVASVYRTEFNEMYGSDGVDPAPLSAKFHSRKSDNTVHQVQVNGKLIEIYFSPGDLAMAKMVDYVKNNADYRSYFSIFAWSDQRLVDELKYKWEGSYNDLEGTRTSFDIKGLFESSYWNQWWSASVDMTGSTASYTSLSNPNTRWANPAPVYMDKEIRKLHAKTMIIDPNTNSDPTVILGSTNWSANGELVNDENMLFIHDESVANQFIQEFYARYQNAGASIPAIEEFIN